MPDEIILSSLPKTWILDLDGTLLKHNGYLLDGKDTLLHSIENLFQNISNEDMVIIVTSRKSQYAAETENFLHRNQIRYDHIIYDAPLGERILINDRKPSGLNMAFAINTKRDIATDVRFLIDSSL